MGSVQGGRSEGQPVQEQGLSSKLSVSTAWQGWVARMGPWRAPPLKELLHYPPPCLVA